MASFSENNPRRLSAYAVYTRNTPKQKYVEESNVNKEKYSKSSSKDIGKKKKAPILNQVADSSIRGKRKFESESDVDKDTTPPVVNGGKAKRGRKKKVVQEKIDSPDPTKEIETDEENDEKENGSSSLTVSTSFNVSNQEKKIPCGNEAAEEAFKWLLNPVKPSAFFEKRFDKKPLLIERSNPNYYKGLFSSQEFDKIMKENSLEYEKEIDVVAYVDDERRTVTNEMKVHPSFVWKAYQEGNSIRMRNPQVYHKQLWKICSLLQEYFSSFVGVNMYLTPAGSQGFPPHYDDIDAFILQIEGRKRWKLYKPRDDSEMLARYSSGDLKEDEIGEPCMEIELKAGDMLYFPRGFIHQAMTTEDVHSLHLTLSSNQLNTWGDLLQMGISQAVEQAIKNDVEFRKSLPKDYLDHVGASYSDCISDERIAYQKRYNQLAQEALTYLSIDHAADAHTTDFIHGSMPPFFSKIEEACSIHGNGSRLERGEVIVTSNLTPQTKIRLIRKRAFRLVMDEEGIRLFYSLGNSKSHKEDEALFMEMDIDVVPAINVLFQAHPDFIKVEDLPIDCIDTKLGLAQQLYDNGFLMTEDPLPHEP